MASREFSPSKSIPPQVGPEFYLNTLWENLTQAMCEQVFEMTRRLERQRKWSLYALVRMWVGLLHLKGISQTQAVLECGRGSPFFPNVRASPEGFFQRIQSLRPEFFGRLFERFTQGILPKAPQSYSLGLLKGLGEFYPEVWALDASRLHKVARRLKVARKTTAAILPGSLEAAYDLRRGILRALHFDPDGARAEKHMLLGLLPTIPAGSLIIYDRYACFALYWHAMQEHGLILLTRASKSLWPILEPVKKLIEVKRGRIQLSDQVVELKGQRLRLIRFKTPRGEWRLLTNELNVEKLPAHRAIELYAARWSIERAFMELKVTLELNHLFNCAPAAVGGQVYTTAIVYNALRLSQAEIAKSLDVEPERLSSRKLFPLILRTMVNLTVAEAYAEVMYWHACKQAGRKLKRPDMEETRRQMFSIPLEGVLLQKRSERRRRRRFCKGRRRFTTYRLMPGAKGLVNIQ